MRYIADPMSLLADLACMLLSNLTKLESICAHLLDLQVPARPIHSLNPSQEMDEALSGMDVEADDPEFVRKKADLDAYAKRLAEQLAKPEEQVPAMARLLDAFEEGATAESQGGSLEALKKRAQRVVTEASDSADDAISGLEKGPDGRPSIKRKTNCNFLASVFANTTVLPRGRDWFVSPLSASTQATSSTAQAALARGSDDDGNCPPASEYPVARIMVFTEHPNLIRRGGVISAIKNILFVKSAHKLLIAPPSIRDGENEMLAGALRATSRPPSSIDMLPYILLPLCDGKELASIDFEDQEELPEACQMLPEDKRRERDSALRLMLVESLLLLCTNLYGRQCLRARGAYIVVRSAHLAEVEEKIAEAVLRLVNILKRDESASSVKDLEDPRAAEEDVGAESVEEDGEEDDMVIEEL